MINRQIQLVSRPTTGPQLANFALKKVQLRDTGPGDVLLQTVYLSLDPYMRARMYGGQNYADCTELDAPMVGMTVSKVIASKNNGFEIGDFVTSEHGWQEYFLSNGDDLKKVSSAVKPISLALGVLGMPGQTGYTGLIRHGRPQSGETVVVSAASGAVGSVVGQVARNLGCRVVGITGSAKKCSYIVDEFGFDQAVDHRSSHFQELLAESCPDGINVYFDNVGGKVFETVLPLLNRGARIPVCGTIAIDRNNPTDDNTGSMQTLMSTILVKQLSLNGFIYTELQDLEPEFRRRVSQWIDEGTLHFKEHIVEGLENAPKAFLGLFKGSNFGKLLVRVSAE